MEGKKDAQGAVYFFHSAGHDALAFDVRPGWQTIRVDLSQSPDWVGRIERLRIDAPSEAEPRAFEIDWVELGSRRRRGAAGDHAR